MTFDGATFISNGESASASASLSLADNIIKEKEFKPSEANDCDPQEVNNTEAPILIKYRSSNCLNQKSRESELENSQDEQIQEENARNVVPKYTFQTKTLINTIPKPKPTCIPCRPCRPSTVCTPCSPEKKNISMKNVKSIEIIDKIEDNFILKKKRNTVEESHTLKYLNKKALDFLPTSSLYSEDKLTFCDAVKMNILIVDDESITGYSTKNLVTSYCLDNKINPEIVVINNGFECLYKVYQCLQSNIPISIILIDENMPYINGSIICNLIKSIKELCDTKIYMMSSQEICNAMADHCYTKPLTKNSIKDIFNHS